MPEDRYKASINKVKKEMPDVSDVDVQPTGFFGRLLSGGGDASGTRAVASPWTGNVSYNPGAMSKLSPDEMDNVFTHELTHSRQIRNTPYLGRAANVFKSMLPGFLGGDESYTQRPREMEAYQAERDRTARLGLRNMPDPVSGAKDIELLPTPDISKRQAMFNRLRGIR